MSRADALAILIVLNAACVPNSTSGSFDVGDDHQGPLDTRETIQADAYQPRDPLIGLPCEVEGLAQCSDEQSEVMWPLGRDGSAPVLVRPWKRVCSRVGAGLKWRLESCGSVPSGPCRYGSGLRTCADPPSNCAEAELLDVPTPDEDVAPCSVAPLEFGCTCTGDGDCVSGLCRSMADGSRLCTKSAIMPEDCPEGWDVRFDPVSAPKDPNWVCMERPPEPAPESPEDVAGDQGGPPDNPLADLPD